MRRERSYCFALGAALGFATIAAALWWVRRQRKPWVQPLVIEAVEGESAEGAASAEPLRSASRHTRAAVVQAALLTVLVGAVIFGLASSTWAINGGVKVSPEVLSSVRVVRDELAASGEAALAVRWLDSALRPATYGSDVLIYLKEAASALPPGARVARQALRAAIGELGGY
jgi:hypothetical protein